MSKTPHSIRRSDHAPDALSLINSKGQFQMVLTFRQGRCTEQYIRFRQWCWLNDVNPSDVFNSIIEPLTHFCENFARRDEAGNILVSFNLGEVMLEKFYNRSYPNREKQGWGNPASEAKYAKTRARKIQLI